MTAHFEGHAFGLTFHCPQRWPELTPGPGPQDGQPPVCIDWAEGDAPVPEGDPLSPGFTGTPRSLTLHLPDTATFQVTADRITIWPAAGAADSSIRAYLFGSAIGALLHLRGLVLLHGSAVRLPDGGVAVFCGLSTAGKSTLAAALAQRGYPLLADDITAVRLDEAGQAWCLPGLARTKLWRNALETLGLTDQARPETQVLPSLDKYALPLGVASAPARISRLYELRAQEQGPLAFAEVKGMAKITLMLAHTFRPGFVEAMGLQAPNLRRVSALAPQVTVSRIDRPRNEPTLAAIIEHLESEWSQRQ